MLGVLAAVVKVTVYQSGSRSAAVSLWRTHHGNRETGNRITSEFKHVQRPSKSANSERTSMFHPLIQLLSQHGGHNALHLLLQKCKGEPLVLPSRNILQQFNSHIWRTVFGARNLEIIHRLWGEKIKCVKKCKIWPLEPRNEIKGQN